MDQIIRILIGVAVLAFVLGSVARGLVDGPILGLEPGTYLKGAMGCLAFAITLILLQIRDRP